jgi:serine/threonine protein kinase
VLAAGPFAGSAYWMAPELLLRMSGRTMQSDVYAFGYHVTMLLYVAVITHHPKLTLSCPDYPPPQPSSCTRFKLSSLLVIFSAYNRTHRTQTMNVFEHCSLDMGGFVCFFLVTVY